jgi:hypothetical protein
MAAVLTGALTSGALQKKKKITITKYTYKKE